MRVEFLTYRTCAIAMITDIPEDVNEISLHDMQVGDIHFGTLINYASIPPASEVSESRGLWAMLQEQGNRTDY